VCAYNLGIGTPGRPSRRRPQSAAILERRTHIMRRKMGLLVLIALVAAAAPLRDDGYTIKIKKSGQGSVTKQDKEETDNNYVKFEGPDGKAKENKEERTVTQAYKETVLEKKEGKRATKLRREYTKAVVKVGDKEMTLPYQGKTVVIEKKDGKYHFTIEGGAELTGKDAELLNRAFNKGGDDSDSDDLEKAFLPKKPVKEGDTWTIDGAAIVKAFEKDAAQPIPVDKDKAAGKGKLLRAYKEGGRQYGDFDIDLDIPLKGEFPLGPGQSAPIQAGSKMGMKVQIKKACIDGTVSDGNVAMSFDMDLTAAFKGPDGKQYKITINSKHKAKSKEEEVPKK
jgi:hypothetical protein